MKSPRFQDKLANFTRSSFDDQWIRGMGCVRQNAVDEYIITCTKEISPAAVQATAEGIQAMQSRQVSWVGSVGLHDDPPPEPTKKPSPISRQTLATAQRDDPAITQVIQYKETKRRPTKQLRQTAALET